MNNIKEWNIQTIIANKEYFKNYDPLIHIRQNIKNKRIEKKLSQQQLADIIGISLSHIQKIENTKLKHSFSIITFIKIAKALNLSISELCKESTIGGIDEKI